MKKNSLKLLAGLIWFAIGALLITRASSWIWNLWSSEDHTASTASHKQLIIYTAIGIAIGIIKGRLLLRKVVYRNIDRVNKLPEPVKAWQLYSLGFIPVIMLMVGLGFLLRHLSAHNNTWWNSWITWAGCSSIYIAIGTALLTSSLSYFQKTDSRL